jgi:hypothetical protein
VAAAVWRGVESRTGKRRRCGGGGGVVRRMEVMGWEFLGVWRGFLGRSGVDKASSVHPSFL